MSEISEEKLAEVFRALKERLRKAKATEPFYAWYDGQHYKCFPDGRAVPVDLLDGSDGSRYSE